MPTNLDYLLLKATNIRDIATKYPTEFNFQTLSNVERSYIVADAPELAKQMNFLVLRDKVRLMLGLSKTAMRKSGLTLTDEEVESLSDQDYVSLVTQDWKKYFDYERFKKLGLRAKAKLFVESPRALLAFSGSVPEGLTSDNIYSIADKNIWLFDEDYITDFSKFTTDAEFWLKLIKADYNKYAPIFMKNLKTCKTATEIRRVIELYPQIIKLMDDDTAVNSNMTAKQWAMFIRRLKTKTRTAKILEDWNVPETLQEAIRLDIMSEVLSGKSKLTKVLQTAIDAVLTEKEEEQDEPAEEPLTDI